MFLRPSQIASDSRSRNARGTAVPEDGLGTTWHSERAAIPNRFARGVSAWNLQPRGRVYAWLSILAGCGAAACPEKCGGECVDRCFASEARNRDTCECESRCPAGFAWVDGACVPAGGDADTDSDTETETVDVPECENDYDCWEIRGAPDCEWYCDGGGCVDDLDWCYGGEEYCYDDDGDGYWGSGECIVTDCDDDDPAILDQATRACYSGPMGTSAVGICADGVQTCVDGVWDYWRSDDCPGEVLPADETCDGRDEDCDGAVDEDGADCQGTFGDPPCGAWQCVDAECRTTC